MGVFLSWRAAFIVALAVPLCYGIALLLGFAFGYTINRVTLFALILSLGLLVDDPITGIDNIERAIRSEKTRERIVAAMGEIKVALLVSTLTIVLAFVPLAFITGMMGPYMAPMAFNVPVSVITSTVVAFLVTPWLAKLFLRGARPATMPDVVARTYRRVVSPMLSSRLRAKQLLSVVLVLFLIASLLPVLRLVPLKLLPFDNKSEIQILIDMPESASLESTAAEARRIATVTLRLPEVKAVAAFVGEPSPNDFNGLVRRYHDRLMPHLADLRVTLVDKHLREHHSHTVVLRLRELLRRQASSANIKVIEVPPGPPVLDTLVAEVYGDLLTDYSTLMEAARSVERRLAQEPHIVQIDTTIQHSQRRLRFVTDREKAALSGISVDDLSTTLSAANSGLLVSYLHFPREVKPLPVTLRLPIAERSSKTDLLRLQVSGTQGVRKHAADGLDTVPRSLVSVGELGEFKAGEVDQAIYHKDLRQVVYVTADLSGRTPPEVIADVHADFGGTGTDASDWTDRTYLGPGGGQPWSLPGGTEVTWGGEGEWRITLRVFRDMGIGFLFALTAIFLVLSLQTGSIMLSLIIMSSIPLTVIGIMPGFWALNQLGEREVAGAPDPVLFTATAMIGMIALAGIVVRNSLILVEFIERARREGAELRDALLDAGAVRMRPVLLTAGTTLLGNLVITLDPVFNGLALAIIFGIISSTVFTLVVVPAAYYLVYAEKTPDVAIEASST